MKKLFACLIIFLSSSANEYEPWKEHDKLQATYFLHIVW